MYSTLLILIPALPLAAAVLVACFGWLLKSHSHWPVVIAIGCSFLLSLMLLNEVQSSAHFGSRRAGTSGRIGFEETYTLWTWVDVHDAFAKTPLAGSPADKASSEVSSLVTAMRPANRRFSISITLRADPLTAIMLAMVTFISTLVAIYSIGYMHGDRGYWRFFSYIALFVFSMTMLVSASNFVLLFVFWEAVGLCSYLLVGFWYQKPEAVAAGMKAFLVNRVGDFCFILGLFLIWNTYGTLDFQDTMGKNAAGSAVVQTAGVLGQYRLAAPGGIGYVGGAVGTAICLLLLAGACGKSAQFPLHVWLPDAMEGPTPVSALIHAATMVTAGVYMIARCTPLFVAAPQAQHAVALIGCFTALMAGIIAMTQTDLKRVLAYSTISQLGYMFLSLGLGVLPGIVFGMFHLFTHAFFKALLFLGAGSVMHAMGGVVDMRRFGGLRRLMPVTFWTFLIGCLALAGVTPFAGFWSKDGILATCYSRGQAAADAVSGSAMSSGAVFGIAGLHEGSFYKTLFWVATITAVLTAFYTFRAFFMTFFGEQRVPSEAGQHAHESPATMTVPMMILAVCATVVGFLLLSGFTDFLTLTPSLAWSDVPALAGKEAAHEEVHNLVASISTVGALLGIGLAAFLYLGDRSHASALARLLSPAFWLSQGKFFFDPIYLWFVVRPLEGLAVVFSWFDRTVIDGLVNLVGAVPPLVGTGLRSLQNGVVQFYALAMILSLLVLVGTMMKWLPW
jgi:NADH-quinone oxidoreductase subunit L